MEYVDELVDPRTGITGYVGITNQPEQRKLVHFSGKYGNEYLKRWVKSILAEDLEPIMNYLAIVDSRKEVKELERYWIGYYLDQGIQLMNVQFFPGKGRPLREIAAEYKQRRAREKAEYKQHRAREREEQRIAKHSQFRGKHS